MVGLFRGRTFSCEALSVCRSVRVMICPRVDLSAEDLSQLGQDRRDARGKYRPRPGTIVVAGTGVSEILRLRSSRATESTSFFSKRMTSHDPLSFKFITRRLITRRFIA